MENFVLSLLLREVLASYFFGTCVLRLRNPFLSRYLSVDGVRRLGHQLEQSQPPPPRPQPQQQQQQRASRRDPRQQEQQQRRRRTATAEAAATRAAEGAAAAADTTPPPAEFPGAAAEVAAEAQLSGLSQCPQALGQPRQSRCCSE